MKSSNRSMVSAVLRELSK